MRVKLSDQEQKLRLQISPSRKIYDQLDSVWMPHIMFLQKNNFRSKICNTDIYGLRFNSSKDIKKKSVFFNNKKNRSILLGASVVFGIGSTSDDKTISSIISDNKNHYINFGGRAYTLFQEILLFLSLVNETGKIKNLIILSGLNDVFLNYNKHIHNNFPGPIYFNNKFTENMNYLSYKQLFKKFINNTKHKNHSLKNVSFKDILKRNFFLLNILKKSYKINPIFILQPYMTWCKEPSLEEKKIIDYMKNRSDKAIYNKVTSSKSKIINLYKKFSSLYNIDFYDSNSYIKSNCSKKDFMFIDYLHLNDYGNLVMKEMIKKII